MLWKAIEPSVLKLEWMIISASPLIVIVYLKCVEDPGQTTDDELYDLLLEEYAPFPINNVIDFCQIYRQK